MSSQLPSWLTSRSSLNPASFPLQDQIADDAYWSIYVSVDTAASVILRTLPDISDQRELHEAELGVRTSPSLVLARSGTLTTILVLHSIDADRASPFDTPSAISQQTLNEGRRTLAREKRIMAARLLAKVTKRVHDATNLDFHAFMGVNSLPYFGFSDADDSVSIS